MAQKKKLLKLMLFLISGTLVLGIIVYILILVHWANSTKLKMIGKNYYDFIVKYGQIVNANDFVSPSGDNSALSQIDSDIRMKIAEYMLQNELILREGHHYFNRVNGTLEEYINNDFKFQKKYTPS